MILMLMSPALLMTVTANLSSYAGSAFAYVPPILGITAVGSDFYYSDFIGLKGKVTFSVTQLVMVDLAPKSLLSYSLSP